MKKVIFALLMLVLGLVLFCSPFMLLAGQSDKALQTLVLNGPDILGFGAEENTEDSKFAAECSNLYPSDNGLSTLTYGFLPTTDSNSVFIEACMVADEVFYNYFTGGNYQVKRYSTQTEIIPAADGGSLFLFAFGFYKSGYYYYAMNEKAMYKATTGAGTKVIGVTGYNLPFYEAGYTATSAAIWKNRLWVSGASPGGVYNRMFISSPTDWEDFTPAENRGNVWDVPNYAKITKLISTLAGLYVVCWDGVYLVSGGDSPDTWRIDKVVTFAVSGGQKSIIPYKGAIILHDGKDVYMLEGYNLQKLCQIPYSGYSFDTLAMWYDRYLAFGNVSSAAGVIYDIQTKSYFEIPIIKGLIADRFFVSGNFLFSPLPTLSQSTSTQITPFSWKSCWITLDGNAANNKEIVRIEMDTLLTGGASAEVGLGYSEKSGEGYISKTFIGKNYTAASKGVRPPTNTLVWNVGLRKAVKRIYLKWLYNSGTVSSTSFIKQIRIFYRNVGNIKGNEIR